MLHRFTVLKPFPINPLDSLGNTFSIVTESGVESEFKFIEVIWEMLLAHAVKSPHQATLEETKYGLD